MVDIYNAENTRIYILKRNKNPGVTTPILSDYYDFTGYLISFKTGKKINDLGTVELELGGISTTALRDYVKGGNYLFVMTGYIDAPNIYNKLIGKYLIEQPVYNNNNTVKIKGIQSSGKNLGNKQLTRTSGTYKIKHQDETLNNVLFGNYGVCVDTNLTPILTNALDVSLIGKKVSIDVDFNNRMELVNKVCDAGEAEWEISHGVNHAVNPFSDGDSLVVKDKIGDQSTSKHTFYLSGSNTNCVASKGVKTVSKLCNDIIIKGTNLAGDAIETEMFKGGLYETYIDLPPGYSSFDGWLIEDVTDPDDNIIDEATDSLNLSQTKTYQFIKLDITPWDAETTLISMVGFTNVTLLINGETMSNMGIGKIYKTTPVDGYYLLIIPQTIGASSFSFLMMFMQDINQPIIKINADSFISYNNTSEVFIKIDDEVIRAEVDTSPGIYTALKVIERGVNASSKLGTGTFPFNTKQSNHKAGADVVLLRDVNAIGTNLLTVTLPLNNNTNFGVGYTYIGSERVNSLGAGSIVNSIKVLRISSSSGSEQIDAWNSSYAHSNKIRVMEGSKTGGGYITPDSVQTGSNIDTYGLYSETFSEESATNKDALDKKCQMLLENRCEVDNVVQLEVDDPRDFFVNVNLGDAVSIKNSDVINLEQSDALPTYRFVEYEFLWPPTKCIVFLNRIEKKNEFNTGETLTETYWRLTPAIANNNDRAAEFNILENPTEAGGKKIYEFFNKELNGVVLNKSFSTTTDEDNNKAVNVQTLKEAINTVSGQSLWKTVDSSAIEPLNSGTSLRPNGTATIGASGDYWNSVYADEYYFASDYWMKSYSVYLDIYGEGKGFVSGVGTNVLLRFNKGNLNTGFIIPSVNFYDSFIVPMLAQTSTDIEQSTYRTYTTMGSMYYNYTMLKLRIYNGTTWGNVGLFPNLTVTTNTAAPTGGIAGDLHFIYT